MAVLFMEVKEMNRLMRQAFEKDQIRGRESRIRVDRDRQKIAYKAPNGTLFFIETGSVEEGGEPVVRSPAADIYSAAHKTHTLGGSRVCLANSLRGWDLTRILLQCDSWARGMELYRSGQKFPSSPKEAFARHPQSGRSGPKKLLKLLFG
ncbi:MAG: hypothetical protein KKE29_21455 [Proteobacteria bacterium]|nr:hypothetical protein [Pseudomonadota bacterium]MBU4577158.1 hypothetical protein [Pseudomonadota bacterium]MBU4599140.1 hypothetical protein [Pseudomonadota bacterium]